LAVVLFNLGGPDSLAAVKPFLRNLFRDPAIIRSPALMRKALAWLISELRTKSAKTNYGKMGGYSPLLPETLKQAEALTAQLMANYPDREVRVFTAMRYWHPFIEETADDVAKWEPDEVVLLPLYPQYSTTTTASSFKAWDEFSQLKSMRICCYPTQPDFLRAHAGLIREAWNCADRPDQVRVLFSAHGLPEKIANSGDPYTRQIEQTAAGVAALLTDLEDWQICYQSRVGPTKWIGPSTESAIIDAARDDKHVLLVPIAFVSEHVETLVELDEEYALLASKQGVRGYTRVPALGCNTDFIKCLSSLAALALDCRDEKKPSACQTMSFENCSECPCKPDQETDT
jgi:ferrochelatase